VPTKEEIEAAKTPNGGWTKKQLAQWGVPWPPPKGWIKRLTGDVAKRGEYGQPKMSERYKVINTVVRSDARPDNGARPTVMHPDPADPTERPPWE
jgi:hypothetical protein